jgi:ankyrin repeat protein
MEDVELIQAARAGSVEEVRHLLEHFSFDVPTLSWALRTAYEEGMLSVVTILVNHTVLKNNAKELNFALAQASSFSQWEIVKWLIENTTADVNCAETSGGNTIISNVINNMESLIRAATEGRVSEVRRLSEHFTDDDTVLSTVLNKACQVGQLSVVIWMVEHAILRLPWLTAVKILTEALATASKHGQLNVIGWLAQHQALENDSYALSVALEQAHAHSIWKVVRWLLSRTIVNVNTNTIIHDVIMSSNSSDNKLISSVSRGDMGEVCKLVYMYDVDINVQDDFGNTPLRWACLSGNSDILGVLLLAAADETISNQWGKTPAQEAASLRRENMLKLLDVDNEWKLLARTLRLRRRCAMQVMMSLVKWELKQRNGMWKLTAKKVHLLLLSTMTAYRYRKHYSRMYKPRVEESEYKPAIKKRKM